MPLNSVTVLSVIPLAYGLSRTAVEGSGRQQPLPLVETAGGYYTMDAICRQKQCINPVFPGLQDLSMLEAGTWQCQPVDSAKSFMQFCGEAVDYDVAIQSPNSSMPLQELVATQERAAATMYRYHLTAMNIEPWDHRKPAESLDSCVQSVWKMVCATYFPRAQAGCRTGEATAYLRPCSNVCQSYVQSCGVECCDESAYCVPSQRQIALLGVQPRYVDLLGPSAQCTGAASRGFISPAVLLAGALALVLPLAADRESAGAGVSQRAANEGTSARASRSLLATAALGVVAVSLQGCTAVGHAAAAWEMKPSYWVNFQFMPVSHQVKQRGTWQVPTSDAVLNSCEIPNLEPRQQCGGNGICKSFGTSGIQFCECDRDWADPECRTRRKSQATAFFLSLFGGPLGLDRFYLGEPYAAILKLSSLGGLGVWWLHDVARVGSSPVYASSDYRLAADLPHWLYVFCVVIFFSGFGFLVFNLGGSEVHRRKEMARMLVEAEEDWKKSVCGATAINPKDRVGMPRISSYAMPMPAPGAYGTMVPSQVVSAAADNQFSSYTVYNSAVGDPALMSSVRAPPPSAAPPREIPSVPVFA
mmetsp:Transcript_70588/g.182007  ORF Transcript_70588/g.182007 Transcript_70588/m.182007 type:complete len:587 (+) Transcript_70588:104-1864(+)